MEPALLGLVLDSSVLIAAERRNLTAAQAIENVQQAVGEIPIILSAVSVAEIGHGIYRADTPELRDRRRAFLDELKATVPIHPLTEATAEIVARIGGEQAARGIILPLADLPHRNLRPGTGLCGWEQQPAGFWQHPGFACDATVNDRAFFRRYRFLYTPILRLNGAVRGAIRVNGLR